MNTHINGRIPRWSLPLALLGLISLTACAAEDPANEATTSELGSELGFHSGHGGFKHAKHHKKRHHKRHRLLETLTVPTETEGVFVSSQSYPANKEFLIKASGQVVWGGCDPVTCPAGGPCGFSRLGDAQFNSDTCFLPPDPTFTSFPLTDIQLFLDGAAIPPAAFEEDHVYKFVVPGNGGPFVFNYNDCPGCYGDNSGSITVRIFSN